jgi:predicted glutamine amidotransferase
MCIAILNKSSLLPFESVKNSWDNNNDGAGVLYINAAGVLTIIKESNSVKKFYTAYKAARAESKHPILLHFRIGTHGNFADYNLHPFLTTPEIGFIHNGVIHIPEIDSRYSDTWHFNSLVLQQMKNPADLFKSGSKQAALINHFCGTRSKLVFLNSKGEFRIFNEAAGHWDKLGNWFSNGTYKKSDWINAGGQWIKKGAKVVAGSGSYSGGGWYGSDYGTGGKWSSTPKKDAEPKKYGPYTSMIDAAEKIARDENPGSNWVNTPAGWIEKDAEKITAPAPAPKKDAGKKWVTIPGRADSLQSISRLLGMSITDPALPGKVHELADSFGVFSLEELHAALLY